MACVVSDWNIIKQRTRRDCEWASKLKQNRKGHSKLWGREANGMVWPTPSGHLTLGVASPAQCFVLESQCFCVSGCVNERERSSLCFQMGHPAFGRFPTNLLDCYLSSWRERDVYRCAMKTGDLGFTGKRRAYLSASICYS